MSNEFYVVVADNDVPTFISKDQPKFIDEGGALVFEQYLHNADLESIKKRAKSLSKKYGKCRIAKLEFV